MKKTVRKETHFCDKCQAEAAYPSKCIRCGAEFCYDCAKTQGVRYAARLYSQGSGDGYYCWDCHNALMAQIKKDPLHSAYLAIQALRAELEDWGRAFDVRKQAAEKRLRQLDHQE